MRTSTGGRKPGQVGWIVDKAANQEDHIVRESFHHGEVCAVCCVLCAVCRVPCAVCRVLCAVCCVLRVYGIAFCVVFVDL